MVHLELHIQVSLGDMFRYPRRVARLLAAKFRAWRDARRAKREAMEPLRATGLDHRAWAEAILQVGRRKKPETPPEPRE